MRVILVAGTWGGKWCEEDSAFRRYLTEHGLESFWFRGWSENVDGVPNILAKGRHREWIAGGFALGYKLEAIPPHERIVIAHSHGGQPAAYCAALAGVYIHRLVTVCTPVRGDMTETWTLAHQHIGGHRHIADTDGDPWQRAGEFLDDHLGWQRDIPGADNLPLDGIGHTGLLEDPQYFHHLVERVGDHAPTLDFLRALALR